MRSCSAGVIPPPPSEAAGASLSFFFAPPGLDPLGLLTGALFAPGLGFPVVFGGIS